MRIEVRDDDCWRRRPRLIGWLVVLPGEIALVAAPLPRDGLPVCRRDHMAWLRRAVRRGRVWRELGWPRLYHDPDLDDLAAHHWGLPGLGGIGGVLFGRVVPDHGDYDVAERDVVPEDGNPWEEQTPCVVVTVPRRADPFADPQGG
jgi:hypothetical protein